jgi:hypothetical protein
LRLRDWLKGFDILETPLDGETKPYKIGLGSFTFLRGGSQ